MPVPVEGGEEAADGHALELDLEGAWVWYTDAIGAGVAFAADVFERAAYEAVGEWDGRVQRRVGRGLSSAYGDLGRVV